MGKKIGLAVGVVAIVAMIAVTLLMFERKPAANETSIIGNLIDEPINQKIQPPSIHFTEITREMGISFVHDNGGFGEKLLPETMGSGVLVFDFDGDGHQDILFVNSCRWPQGKYDKAAPPARLALYKNDGTGHFRDVTVEVGLGDLVCYGMGVAAGDIDNDGFPDVIITCVDRVYLLHNEGGKRFKDITKEAGLDVCRGWCTAAAFLDYDRDGKLDLFIGRYVKWTPETDIPVMLDGKNKSYAQPDKYEGEHCKLFHNVSKDGVIRFDDVSAKAGIEVVNGKSGKDLPMSKCLGVAICDYDGDDWPDIAVANDTTPNFLFHNKGDGTFENVAQKTGVELINQNGSARGAMGIGWGYYRDNGQTLGLAVANFANEPDGLLKYAPRTKSFSECAMGEGIGGPSRHLLKFGLLLFDYDLDGRLDLFTNNGHIEPDIAKAGQSMTYAQPTQLFWNVGPGHQGCFREVEREHAGEDLFLPRVGRGAAYGDLDGDGDLDLVLNNNNSPAAVLRNGCPPGVTAIRLKLVGRQSNRDAYGAKVKVYWSDNHMQQAELTSGGSYMSQSESVLTFGLHGDLKADRIVIRWPSPKVHETELKDVSANATYIVDEEKGIVEKKKFQR